MDLIKTVIEKLTVGSVTTLNGCIVYRTSKNAFAVGETISIKQPRVDIDEAARIIYEVGKNF